MTLHGPNPHSRSRHGLMGRVSLATAVDEVAGRDPVMANLVALVGPLRHRPRSADGHFGALVRSIASQQLSGRAAHTILGRVVTAAGGRLTAEAIAAVPDAAIARSRPLGQQGRLGARPLNQGSRWHHRSLREPEERPTKR